MILETKNLKPLKLTLPTQKSFLHPGRDLETLLPKPQNPN